MSLSYLHTQFTIVNFLCYLQFVLPLFLIWVTITRGSIDSIEGDVDPSLDLKLSLYGETQSYVAGAARGQELYKQVVAKEGSSVTSVKGDMITCK